MKKNKLFVSMLAAGLMSVTPVMGQDVVKLTTGKAAGEKISLQLNQPKASVTVDWGDGTTTTVAKSDQDLLTLEGQLKGNVVTITSESKITTLLCAGNDLTAIDVTAAPNLRSLYCQNNKLEKLDVSNCGKLNDLNCSNNEISKLLLSAESHPEMENLNVANNKLKTLSGSGANFSLPVQSLQHLDISHNLFSAITLTSQNQNLSALKCQGNKLSNLRFQVTDSLSTVICSDNKIAKVAVDTLPKLRYFFAENNAIDELDLHKAEQLRYLSVDNNKLEKVTFAEDLHLYAYTCGTNNLTFSSLYADKDKNRPDNYRYEPQASEIDITAKLKRKNGVYYMPLCPKFSENDNAKYQLDLSDYCWDLNGKRVSLEVYGLNDNDEFVELKKGTSSNPADYYFVSNIASYGKIAFFTPQRKVYVKFSTGSYRGLEFTTTKFAVGDPSTTGIGQVVNGETDELSVKVGRGVLTLQSASERAVSVYSTSGKLMWKGQVAASPVSVQLPAGVYVVNGKKVVL